MQHWTGNGTFRARSIRHISLESLDCYSDKSVYSFNFKLVKVSTLFWPRHLIVFLKMWIHLYIRLNPHFHLLYLLHIKVRLSVLLCAVKTVEGDFRFCWTITPNVGQTHKENPNLVRILYMVCTLNDIYKQYNKLHEHWYTNISSLRCVADRNPTQNASDLYTKYWSYAEHCRPCTRLSGVNWWNQKQITLIVPIGYSLFADHRSVPSSGPGFVCLTNFCLSRVCAH